jgi:hypothetical protein
MRSGVKAKAAFLFLFLALFRAGMAGGEEAPGEREKLMEQQKALRSKIEVLRREQDFLLFEKALYDSDSKYLIINLGAKKGQLKYKNRVLKDFRFVPSKNPPVHALKPGALTLTTKREDSRKRPVLLFGKSLIIQGKRPLLSRQEAGIPYVSLTRSDLRSVFYAVEEGTKAYLVR